VAEDRRNSKINVPLDFQFFKLSILIIRFIASTIKSTKYGFDFAQPPGIDFIGEGGENAAEPHFPLPPTFQH
jgi:hypothetical protein